MAEPASALLVELVMAAIQDGLPLVPRPFLTVARALGVDEGDVLHTVRELERTGVIKRMGLVVKHRTLGYRANAMVVWDVPDQRVDDVGRALSDAAPVTLCYRRPRALPSWPYNLFCMIHGRSRGEVLVHLEALVGTHALEEIPRDVLFSTHCFKQRGARYVRPPSREVQHGRA